MKKLIFTTFILLFFIKIDAFTEAGDTLKLIPIEFQGAREGWFEFPESDLNFEKIIMEYKLRCPPGKPCGEWDYIVNLFLRKYYAPNYSYKGRSPDTTFFMTSAGKKYIPIYDGENVIGFDSTDTENQWVYFYDYKNSENPTRKIDSIKAWDRYYSYILQDGKIIDSTLSKADEFIALDKSEVFFNDKVTIYEQFEVFRYITPYGNNLDLGTGFSWIIDMSDFRPMFSGKVYFYAPATPSWIAPMSQNAYEDLELTFNFIEGTPERNVLAIDYLWHKGINYNENYEKSFPAFNYTLPENAKSARFKLIQTGHGFGDDTENCAEFCEKMAYLKVNSQAIWEKNVWRECGDNPVYPQGGTWLADRSNWCPGAEVVPYDIELTEFYTPGETIELDYDMEYFKPVKAQDPSNFAGNYLTTAFIVTYDNHNFSYDVEITDVLSPSNKDMFARLNPTCSNPEIILRNRGKETVNNLEIFFSINDGEEYSFEWNGSLAFNQLDTVFLPGISWVNRTEGNFFKVRIENPNGQEDEYPSNNKALTYFDQVTELHKNMILKFQTVNYNAYGAQSPYRYAIYDVDGNIIRQRTSTENSKLYIDTLNLENGCYTFVFVNLYGYGLSYWPLSALNNGYLQFEKEGIQLVNFKPDFGNTQYLQFIVKDQPEIKVKDDLEYLDFGQVNIQEKVTKYITILAANDEPVKITKAEIRLGSLKGFEIKSITPAINDELTITKDSGMEIEIEYTGKLIGNQSADLLISSSNTFYAQQIINLRGVTVDPSSVNEFTNEIALEVIYDSKNNAKIYYNLLKPEQTAKIYLSDILGNVIQVIYNGSLVSGESIIDFNSQNLSSGIYFITLQTDRHIAKQKFVITK